LHQEPLRAASRHDWFDEALLDHLALNLPQFLIDDIQEQIAI
jgi:hypothetical protein